MSPDLERRLRELGRHLDFPQTPDLAAAMTARLPARPARRLITRWRGALVAFCAAAAIVFGVPPVRTALAHWLGIQGVVIRPMVTLPATPRVSSPASGAPGAGLGLGQPVSLAAAERGAGFTVVLPSGLGMPDAVYLRSDVGPVVSLVYGRRPGLAEADHTGVGLLLTEFRGATNPMLMQKFVGPGTTITPVLVAGQPGFWISGAMHAIAYRLPDGSFAPDTLRLAGPTLVYQRGDLAVRLEGALTEPSALALAASIR